MSTLLLFLAGSLVGFFSGFTFCKYSKPFRDLQKKLSTQQAEYHRYQDEVAAHFQKTADLFSELQVRQDNLVNHLQEGAKHLRGGMLPSHDTVAITGFQPGVPKDYPLKIEA